MVGSEAHPNCDAVPEMKIQLSRMKVLTPADLRL